MGGSSAINRFPPRVLSVAGSDSGGGAGIQADLKTCQELGVFGMTAITAVTAQNSLGVTAVYPLAPEAVEAQLDAVLGDIGADAVKTGMLLSPDTVRVVAAAIVRYGVPHLVVDPVLSAKDGSALLRREAVHILRQELLPLAEVVTPNIPEACELLDIPEPSIASVADMTDAARELLGLGSGYVLLKGGHLTGEKAGRSSGSEGESVDVLVGAARTGMREPVILRAPRIPTSHTHGTGCTTASAVAAYLALGRTVPEAVLEAKRFVTAAIASSVPLGKGVGSLWHGAGRVTAGQ